MADLDRTAREAVRRAPADFRRWVLPGLAPDLVFRRWLDTEATARQGEPRRRCDTLMELTSDSGAQGPGLLLVEVEAKPRSTMRWRPLDYVLRQWRTQRHGPGRRDRYPMHAVVVFLSGRVKSLDLSLSLPGLPECLAWRPTVWCLAAQRAAEVLDRIERGELGRGVLPWVPLTKGGCEPGVAAWWVRLAEGEPNEERRGDFASDARVFADWKRCGDVWAKALEGWGVWKSPFIEGWRTEGVLKGRREALLESLEARFPGEPLEDLKTRFEGVDDPAVLARWLRAAATATTLDSFRDALRADPPA